MKKYHYTYILYNGKKSYIGVRSCKCPPEEDYKYLGSMKDKEYKKSIKSKVIIKEWSTRQEAVNHEIELHKYFDVGRSPLFANRVKQTSTGFDTAGIKTNRPAWNRGKNHPISEETKRKISETLKGQKSPMKGRTHTKEAKKKMSEACKGRTFSKETRRKLSESQKGENHNNYDPTIYCYCKDQSIVCDTKYNLVNNFGFHRSSICKTLDGRHKSIQGFSPLFCPLPLS